MAVALSGTLRSPTRIIGEAWESVNDSQTFDTSKGSMLSFCMKVLSLPLLYCVPVDTFPSSPFRILSHTHIIQASC